MSVSTRQKVLLCLVSLSLLFGTFHILPPAFGYTASNVDVIAHLGGPARRVAAEGDYAYFCVGNQLHVAHRDSLGHVSMVGVCILPGQCRDVAVKGGYAYVTAVTAGLFVVHVGDPTHPSHMGTVSGFYAYGVAVEGRYLYVTAGSSLRIFDLLDPSKPVQIGALSGITPGYHPCVRNGMVYMGDSPGSGNRFLVVNAQTPTTPTLAGLVTNLGGCPYDIALAGNYAFGTTLYYGFMVIDVSSPSTPTLVTRLSPFDGFSLAVAGNYAYVQGYALDVFDITTPTAPTAVLFNWPGIHGDKWSITGIAVSGSTLYAGCGRGSDVRYADISVPSSPTAVMSYPLPSSSQFVWADGEYAYLLEQSGLMIVNSHENLAWVGGINLGIALNGFAKSGNYAYVCHNSPAGFSVLDISDPASPSRITSVSLTATSVSGLAASGSLLGAATTSGTLLYSLANPTSPTYLGRAPQSSTRLAFAQPNILAAGGYGSVNLYNVSNPTSPVTFSAIPTGTANSVSALATGGHYLSFLPGGFNQRPSIYNIAVPASPAFCGTLSGTGSGLRFGKDVFALAAGSNGCLLYDFRYPYTFAAIGGFDTDTNGNDVAVGSNDRVFVMTLGGGWQGQAYEDHGLWVISQTGGVPDLRVSFDFYPNSVEPGATETFAAYVLNDSNATVNTPFTIAVLGSPSKDFLPPYTAICAPIQCSTPIPPQQSFYVGDRTIYSTAEGMVPGFYYLGVRCDVANTIYERSESNNLALVLDRPLQIGSPVPTLAVEPAFTKGTSNTLFWGAIAGATGYYLEWSANSTFTPVAGNSGWTSATAYAATGLQNGQMYYYHVKCRFPTGGESTWSNLASSRQDATPPTTPGTPTDAGTYTTATARFNWTGATDSGSGMGSYDLQVGTTAGGSNVFNANVGNVLTATATGSNGQQLYARVRARDAVGNIGSWSGSSNGVVVDSVPPTVPGTPKDAGLYTSSTWVRFDWTGATDSGSGMGAYILQVGTTPGGYNVFNANVGNVLTRTVAGLNGQRLFARVRGRDKAGNAGAWSASSDGITVDTAQPHLTNVTATDYATLRVTFDETVNNADKISNYTCTRGLCILGVVPLSGTQYRLYTTEQTPNISYTLTVKNAVKDRAGNAIHPSYCSRAFLGGRATGVRGWQLYR